MNLVVRRLLAFALDYVLISVYLLFLVAVSLAILASGAREAYQHLWSTSWTAESAGFVLLTLPVVLYFAILETSSARATLGKRILRLQVVAVTGERLSPGRGLLRSSLKFAPWELAHFTISQVVYQRGGGSGLSRIRRNVYDRLSGAIVTNARR